jgi:hypothetical protein
MLSGRESRLRLIARVYAVLIALLGLGIVVAVAMLAASFGVRSMSPKLFLVMSPAAAAFLLAYFVWKRHILAILIALPFAIALRFAFGNETLFLNVTLTAAALMCAALTGLYLWQQSDAGTGND